MREAVHTFPVPAGCSVEFAWMLHCAGVPMCPEREPYWVNFLVDEESLEILHIYTAEDELGARKELMRSVL